MIDFDGFKAYLEKQDYSICTKKCYVKGIEEFLASGYTDYSLENEIQFKNEMVHKGYKAASINARLHGVNAYAKYLGTEDHLKDIKVVLEPFLVDNMTYRDYRILVTSLLKDKNYKWYIIVKFLATTGLRIGEALNVTFGDIRNGHCMVYGKGQKPRTVYFSEPFVETIYPYIQDKADDDYVIPYTDGACRTKLLYFKDKYRLPCKCSPHEFRRFFAREMYARTKDMELVRSLLGHEQISMTSRYIRKGLDDAQREISWAITW